MNSDAKAIFTTIPEVYTGPARRAAGPILAARSQDGDAAGRPNQNGMSQPSPTPTRNWSYGFRSRSPFGNTLPRTEKAPLSAVM